LLSGRAKEIAMREPTNDNLFDEETPAVHESDPAEAVPRPRKLTEETVRIRVIEFPETD
jgi:hypothetical protein